GVPRGWLWSLLGLQLLIAALLIGERIRSVATIQTQGANGVAVAELKAVAIALEERSLYAEAADSWSAYLQANPHDPERPQILFRAGKLAVRAEDFSRALTLLIQCEQAGDDGTELKAKTGPLVVECLRRLGHYGEVGRELSRRVEPGAEQGGTRTVLATIAGEEFTQADLDQLVERRVDQMLSVSGASSDATQRNALIKQLSNAEMRQRLLNEFLQTELFSRRARELKMDRDDEYVQARRLLVENLLSSRLLARELDKIQPTDVDVEAYYRTNLQQYQQPASMSLVLLEVDGTEGASSLLGEISTADEFLAQVVAMTPDVESESALPRHRITHGRLDPKLGETQALFDLSQGEWTQSVHTGPAGKLFLVLCDRKTASRTPRLAELHKQVETDYRNRKRRELSQKLFSDLMTRYDVKISQVPAVNSENAKPSAADSKPSDKQDDGS
ncbi:MAG: hypothetical protein ABGZ17_24820, partial [Planctomycetaceae bacterium]